MSRSITAVTLAALLLTVGCGDGSEDSPTMDTATQRAGDDPSRDQGSGSDDASHPNDSADSTGSAAAGAATHTVLGAGVTLPHDLEWQVAEVNRPTYDEKVFVGRTTDGSPACSVRLAVSTQPEMDRATYEEFLRGLFREDLTSYETDPDAPAGSTGVIARAEIPQTNGSGVDLAVFRQWWSEGGSGVTAQSRTEPGTPARCDPDAIVQSLVWDGAQRPLAP